MPTANRNSASQEIGSATKPWSTANHNSAFQKADSATRLRSTANDNSPLASAWNQRVKEDYPSGASPDLLAPTASTASPILDQSEFRTPI